eukprot:tig00020965_g16854.t1
MAVAIGARRLSMDAAGRGLISACLLLLALASPACAIERLYASSGWSGAGHVPVEPGVPFGPSAESTASANVRWYYHTSDTADAVWSGTTSTILIESFRAWPEREVVVLCELADGWTTDTWGWPAPSSPQERLDAIRTRGAISRVTYKTDMLIPGDSNPRSGYRLDPISLVLKGSAALSSRTSVGSTAICPTPILYGSDKASGTTEDGANVRFYLVVLPWNSAYAPADWRLPASPSAELTTLLDSALWTQTFSSSRNSYPRIVFQYPASRAPAASFTTPALGPAVSAPVFMAGSSHTLAVTSSASDAVDLYAVELSALALEDREADSGNDEQSLLNVGSMKCESGYWYGYHGSALTRALEGHSAGAAGFGAGLVLGRLMNYSSTQLAASKGANSRCLAFLGSTSTGSLSYTVDDARLTLVSGTTNNLNYRYDYSKCTRPCLPGLKAVLAIRASDGLPLAFTLFSVDVDKSEYCYIWSEQMDNTDAYKFQRWMIFGPYLVCAVAPSAPSAYVCSYYDFSSNIPELEALSAQEGRTFHFGDQVDTRHFTGSEASVVGTPAADLKTHTSTIYNIALNESLSWSASAVSATRPWNIWSPSTTSNAISASPLVDFLSATSGTIPASTAPASAPSYTDRALAIYASGLVENTWANISARVDIRTDDPVAPVAGYYAEPTVLRFLVKGLVQGSSSPGATGPGCTRSNAMRPTNYITEELLCGANPLTAYKDMLTGASGQRGKDILLTNFGSKGVTWSLAPSGAAPWLSLSPSSGHLGPMENASVAIIFDASASVLELGFGNETVELKLTSNVSALSHVRFDGNGSPTPFNATMEVKRPFAIRPGVTLSFFKSATCSSSSTLNSKGKTCSCYGDAALCACTLSSCRCTGTECAVVSGPVSVDASNGRLTGPGRACFGLGCSLTMRSSDTQVLGTAGLVGPPYTSLDNYLCDRVTPYSELWYLEAYFNCYGEWGQSSAPITCTPPPSYVDGITVTAQPQLPCQNIPVSEVSVPLGYGSQDAVRAPWSLEVVPFQPEPAAAVFFTNTRPTAVGVRFSFASTDAVAWLVLKKSDGTTVNAGDLVTVPALSTLTFGLGVSPSAVIPPGTVNVNVSLASPDYPRFDGLQAILRVNVRKAIEGSLQPSAFLNAFKPAQCTSSSTLNAPCSCFGGASSCLCGTDSCRCTADDCFVVSGPTKLVNGRLTFDASVTPSSSYDTRACWGVGCASERGYCNAYYDYYGRVGCRSLSELYAYSNIAGPGGVSSVPYTWRPMAALLVASSLPAATTVALSTKPVLPWLVLKPVSGATAGSSAGAFSIPARTTAAFAVGVAPDVPIEPGNYWVEVSQSTPEYPDVSGVLATVYVTIRYPFSTIVLTNATTMPPLAMTAQVANPSTLQSVTYSLSAPMGQGWLSVSPAVVTALPDTEASPASSAVQFAFNPALPGLYSTKLFAETSDSNYPLIPAGQISAAALPVLVGVYLSYSSTPQSCYNGIYCDAYNTGLRVQHTLLVGSQHSGFLHMHTFTSCPSPPSIAYRVVADKADASWARLPSPSGLWNTDPMVCSNPEAMSKYQRSGTMGMVWGAPASVPIELDARGLKPGSYGTSFTFVPSAPFYSTRFSVGLRVMGLIGNYSLEGRFRPEYYADLPRDPNSYGGFYSMYYGFYSANADVVFGFLDGAVSTHTFYLQAPKVMSVPSLTCSIGLPSFSVVYWPSGPSIGSGPIMPIDVPIPITLNVTSPFKLSAGQRLLIGATADLTGANSVFKRDTQCYGSSDKQISKTAFVKCAETSAFDENFVLTVAVVKGRVVPDVCPPSSSLPSAPKVKARALRELQSEPGSVVTVPAPVGPTGTQATAAAADGATAAATAESAPPAPASMLSSPPWTAPAPAPEASPIAADAVANSASGSESPAPASSSGAVQARTVSKRSHDTGNYPSYTCDAEPISRYTDSTSLPLPLIYNSDPRQAYGSFRFFNNSASKPPLTDSFSIGRCLLPADFAGTYSIESDSSWMKV